MKTATLLLVVTAIGCARRQPVEKDRVVVDAAVPDAAVPDAATPDAATPDGEARDARCRGTDIDLTVIVLQSLCREPGRPGPSTARALEGALAVTADTPLTITTGTEVQLTYTFTNLRDAELPFTVSEEMTMAEMGIIGLLSTAEEAKVAPFPKEAPFMLAPGIKGAAGNVFAPKADPHGARSDDFAAHAVIHLAPHGKAVLHARMLAKGWLPKKKYRVHDTYAPPDLLPPGHYTVSPEVPVDGVAIKPFTVDVGP